MTGTEHRSRPPTPRAATPGAGETSRASRERGTGFLAVVQSVLAAGIGVQPSANRERDFTRGRPLHFIVGGVIGTLVFVLGIWALVRYLIATG